METAQDIFEKIDDYLIGWYFHNSKTIEKTFEDRIREKRFKISMDQSKVQNETLNLQKEMNKIQEEMYIYIKELLYLKEMMLLKEVINSYPKELTLQNIHFIKILNQRNNQMLDHNLNIWKL